MCVPFHRLFVKCGQDGREGNLTMSDFTDLYDVPLPTYSERVRNGLSE